MLWQSVKMEAEKALGSVQLKLEYAEKYNEDAKSREKENKVNHVPNNGFFVKRVPENDSLKMTPV